MVRTMSLAAYVKYRNGVPMGASGSLMNMLKRSLGAPTFRMFWQHWNPIWGYYLSYKVMKPLSRYLPVWVSIILTFMVSGALHDLAVGLIQQRGVFFFTPWFSLMGALVVISSAFDITYHHANGFLCGLVNVSLLVGSFCVCRLYFF